MKSLIHRHASRQLTKSICSTQASAWKGSEDRKSGLVGRCKTASLVLRTESNSGGVQDVENDIDNPNVWSLIANFINDSSGAVKSAHEERRKRSSIT